MFKVFISARALSDIYLKESKRTNKRNQSNWFRILLKQHTLYTIGTQIPSEAPDDDDVSDAAILWHLCENENIELAPSDEYLSHIVDQPQTVLEQPCGVFYLDISPKVAKRIQEEYGVICQSCKKTFDAKVLAGEGGFYDITKKAPAHQWPTILQPVNAIPSNALCLIDRNLFVYDGQENPYSHEVQFSAVENIFGVLNSILPQCYADSYHVSVLFEYMPLKDSKNNVIKNDHEHFKEVCKKVFERVKDLKRGYSIKLEMIAFKKGKRFYNDITHDRYILSNYFCVSASNGLNVINYNKFENTGTYNQKIDVYLPYSVGLRNDRSGTSPIDTNNRITKGCRDFISFWRKNADIGDYLYASNFDGDFTTHKNRLFN